MINENFDLRKFKCRSGVCKAPLPQVYCQRVVIQRREIPRFVELLDALGDDALLSYHVLPPQESDSSQRGFDSTWIFIWVDPRKHHSPELLVKAGANIACGVYTLGEELEYLANRNIDEDYLNTCRELNCPVCSKNHKGNFTWVMTGQQYFERFIKNTDCQI